MFLASHFQSTRPLTTLLACPKLPLPPHPCLPTPPLTLVTPPHPTPGTLDYMSPEVLRCPDKRLPSDNKEREDLWYTSLVDVWATGVLAYEMLVGIAPFQGPDKQAQQHAIYNSNPTFPPYLSDSAVDFMTIALSKDPAKRPSIQTLVFHPWLAALPRSNSLNPAKTNIAQERGTPAPTNLRPTPMAPTPLPNPPQHLTPAQINAPSMTPPAGPSYIAPPVGPIHRVPPPRPAPFLLQSAGLTMADKAHVCA